MNLNPEEIKKIEDSVKEFFAKTTFTVSSIAVVPTQDSEGVEVNVTLPEPRFFIGQDGQTLFELQCVLRMMLNKMLGKNFPVAVDVNNYRQQKVEYLKKLAREAANEVVLTQQSKMLSPMSSYERRIIHLELEGRQDVATESLGEGEERKIIVKPVL